MTVPDKPFVRALDATNPSARRGLPPSAPRQAGRQFLAAAGLMLLVLASYAPLAGASYIWDDDDYVTNNITLRSVDGLRRMWFEIGAVPQYYPLVHSSFWLEYHLWGLSPFGYHLVNVLLHATSVILLWRLLAQLQVPGALLAAALFAVHPIEVESVAWITERKNVLSLTLALASVLCYLRFLRLDLSEVSDETPRPRWSWYALALGLFAGALLSKTVIATLPAVVLVIVWWKRGRITILDFVPLVPLFALGATLGLVTVWMEKHLVGARGTEWDFTPMDRILIAGRALWFYAAKLAWPSPLVFFYRRWQIDPAAWWQHLYPLSAVAAIAALWWARTQIGRGALAGVLIFAGVMVPALGFFDVYPMRFSFVADHFQYHAGIALLVLAAATAARVDSRLLPTTRLIGRLVAAAVVGFLALATCWRTQIYYDPAVLYQDTIDRNPDCTIAYTNLAGYLDSIGQYDRGVALAYDAARRFPQDAGVNNNLAAALLRQVNRDGLRPGALDEIVAHLNIALAEKPDDVGGRNNLGFALSMAGRFADAESEFTRVLEIDPYNAEASYGLAGAQARQGRSAAAATSYRHALQLNPQLAPARYGLAMLLVAQGKVEDAQRELETALAIDSRLVDAHYELAGLLARRGDWRGAANHYQAALELRPHYDRALNNLGVALMNLGEIEQAIRHFAEAVQQNPDYSEARRNLDAAREMQRQSPAPPREPNR